MGKEKMFNVKHTFAKLSLRLIAMKVSLLLVMILAVEVAVAGCYQQVQEDDLVAVNAIKNISAGNYKAFIDNMVEKGGHFNFDKTELAKSLQEYFPKGFDRCRVVARNNYSEYMTSYIVEFRASEEILFLYLVSLSSSEGFSSAVAQFQISNNFLEVFNLWK